MATLPFFPRRIFTALQTGASIELDMHKAVARDLFQISGSHSLGSNDNAAGLLYGFFAEDGATPFLARWNNQEVRFYIGRLIAEQGSKGCCKPKVRMSFYSLKSTRSNDSTMPSLVGKTAGTAA